MNRPVRPASEAALVTRLVRDRQVINRELGRVLEFGNDVPARLARAMRYAALGPGKRIRPILALEAFRAAGGGSDRSVLPFCCGIEMIHAFSLVHDDLPSMDDDDVRRGRPSLHRKFDEGTALLAADGLFAYALELFCRGPAPEQSKLQAIAVISRAVGPRGMTGGQMLDVGSNRPDWRLLLELQRKKTAEFIAAAVTAGGVLAGAGPDVKRNLMQAGLALGRLFQITDDLLDETQLSDRGRMTMTSVLGTDGTRSLAQSEASRAARLFLRCGNEYAVLAAIPGYLLKRGS